MGGADLSALDGCTFLVLLLSCHSYVYCISTHKDSNYLSLKLASGLPEHFGSLAVQLWNGYLRSRGWIRDRYLIATTYIMYIKVIMTK